MPVLNHIYQGDCVDILNKKACNGWDYWYIEGDDELVPLDLLRSKYREMYMDSRGDGH